MRPLSVTLLLIISLLSPPALSVSSGWEYNVRHYDEYDGLSQRYITQIVQGDDGFIWVGTWNGLDRFDGYEFVNFKSRVGGEENISSDRIMNIVKNSDGNLLCLIDQQVFLFNTDTYTFSNLSEAEQKILQSTVFVAENKEPEIVRTLSFPDNSERSEYTYSLTDNCGNIWFRSNFGIYKFSPRNHNYIRFPQEKPSQIRALYADREGRYWVSDRTDETIRLFNKKDNSLIGYLNRDGSISSRYSVFGAQVFCFFQDSKGNIWMGAKPEAIFLLHDEGGRYSIKEYSPEFHLPDEGVTDIKEDRQGRIWIATFKHGLMCVPVNDGEIKLATKEDALEQYPRKGFDMSRYIFINDDGTMLVATTDGLIAADTRIANLRNMTFKIHVKEYKRLSSLSNNATMFVFKDHRGRIFVCTESGGVNQILTKNLMADKFNFKHFDTTTGLPCDIALSMTENGGSLWIVSNKQLIRFNPDNNITESFDARFFGESFRFSDATPLRRNDGLWLFGLQDGGIILDLDHLGSDDFVPPIAITGISVQNSGLNTAVNGRDTITLQSYEKSLTVYFSALDYRAPENIEYAFFMNGEWNNIRHNHSATFLDLTPGTYTLKIRSTNASGQWLNNIRALTIIVRPAWWQTRTARIAFLLSVLVFISAIAYFIRYIQRIKTRNKNLETYLRLMNINNNKEKSAQEEESILEKAKIKAADSIFMKRIVSFVEQHMADSDVSIGEMASAAATSRTGLNRKMKDILGITPNDFLREARIQKACRMLRQKNIAIAEIAYNCGFSDSKYFSRVFKEKKGMTPSEYRNKE